MRLDAGHCLTGMVRGCAKVGHPGHEACRRGLPGLTGAGMDLWLRPGTAALPGSLPGDLDPSWPHPVRPRHTRTWADRALLLLEAWSWRGYGHEKTAISRGF